MTRGKKLCLHCGSQSNGTVRGSLVITLILLCFWLIPGIIYEMWRGAAGRTVCPTCRQPGLIPVISPAARKYLENNP